MMQFRQDFIDTVNTITLTFPDNATASRILNGAFTLSDYHLLLLSMFHCAYEVSSATALAASHCPQEHEQVRALLMDHAAERSAQWKLILNDLKATDFSGPDPRQSLPLPETQAYVAYNFYVASRAPVARLAIAATIESISRSFSTNYSTKVFQCLSLKPSQTSFFYRTKESGTTLTSALKAFEACDLTDQDWQWIIHASRTAGGLYKAIYDAR